MKMEVEIISREIIKPSTPRLHHLEPYKLCLLDQLGPDFYTPIIIFYPLKVDGNVSIDQTLTHLKISLSKTLTLLYPFSGRIKDNVFIDNFDEGVPFLEARVNCTMSKFFENPELESMNKFLPCFPCNKELGNEAPVIAFQVNIFSCGGIAISGCMSHKICDGTTAFYFTNTWFSINRGSDLNKLVLPNFSMASTLFPPINPFPEKYKSILEKAYFQEGDYVTKRFVFDEKVVTALRLEAKAKNEQAPLPSRVVALSSFIWKYFMAASKAVTSDPTRQSVVTQVVNLRQKIKPHLPLIGNVVLPATAVANPAEGNIELHELAKLLSDAIHDLGENLSKKMQVDNGFEYLSASLEQEEMPNGSESDMLTITSMANIGLDDSINFGAGRPAWFGSIGKVGPAFFNLVMLIETKMKKEIEAYVILEEKRMAVLENDPEFLAYASLNPKIETS